MEQQKDYKPRRHKAHVLIPAEVGEDERVD
jgi:hypothetical protein